MRIHTILIGIMTVLFVQTLFEPDAAGKRKKHRNKKAKAEEVEAEAPNVEEEPSEATVMMSSDESAGEAAQNGEKQSITDQINGNESDGGMRRSNRMEFDERLVKGQAAKSGAVYLFKRVPRHLPGLVPMRRSYRDRIVQPVLGKHPLKPARYSFEVERALKAQKRKVIEQAPETNAELPKVEEQPTTEKAPSPVETMKKEEDRPRSKKRKRKK